jgi:hypothetical protein
MKELGLTYMEVSAKTGNNIKEFFKELSYVIAGGNKKKDDTTSTKTAETVGKPIVSNNVNLTASGHK